MQYLFIYAGVVGCIMGHLIGRALYYTCTIKHQGHTSPRSSLRNPYPTTLSHDNHQFESHSPEEAGIGIPTRPTPPDSPPHVNVSDETNQSWGLPTLTPHNRGPGLRVRHLDGCKGMVPHLEMLDDARRMVGLGNGV